MAQDTRKDPRAKVLTMTVRYKSATLDEFIEHHSYDISRGGMFIKTPSPFPPGTLLKFEVKIAEDQRLMQGVGRVVWKREPPDTNADRPAGMGVKFIKIDEQSKKLIDQLVSSRGEGTAAFEQGEAPASAVPSIPAAAFQEKAPEPEPSGRPVTVRKATMIGLGAMAQGSESEPAPPAAPDESFFPKGDDKPMPAPEDRTVMKQAAELLEDALREAGGSMEEVGDTRAAPAASARPPEELSTPAVPDTLAHDEARSAPAAFRDSPVPVVKDEPRPERVVSAVEARAAARGEPQRSRSEPARELRVSEGARRPSVSPLEEPSTGGGGKIIALLLGVAAAAALVFFLTRQKPEEPGAEPVAPAAPVAQEPVAAPATEPAAATPTAAPIAADAAEAPQATADAGAAVADAAAAAAEPPVEKPAPTPKPEVKVRPAPKPKPKAVAPKPETPPAEEPATEPAPKPESKPKAEPAPKAEPKPKPPPTEESDNPY